MLKLSIIILTYCLWMSVSWAKEPSSLEHSGVQLSAYSGVAQTTIHPGLLQGLSETDLLHPTDSRQQQVDFTWGLGAAYRFLFPEIKKNIIHDISLGLDFWYFNTTQGGQTWLFEQVAYNNYDYHLPITTWRLLADSEWTFRSIVHPHVFPFIEGGMGFAQNSVSYNDTPLISETFGLMIDKNSQYQFAYTVGGGVKILLLSNWVVSLRYLYADLGNATTNTTNNAGVTLAAPITIRLTTQTWLAGLTYAF